MSSQPPRPLEIALGPFQGMSAARHPAYLAQGQARLAYSIDFTDGSLRGLYKPGTAQTTGVTGGTLWMHHRDGVGWLYRNDGNNFVCFDGTAQAGSYSVDAPVGVSYYTSVSAGVASKPQIAAGANWVDKDLAVTTNAITSVTGAAAAARGYRITRVIQLADLNVTWESNPSAIVTTTNAIGATVNFAAAGTNATGVIYLTRVYACALGATAAPFYLIAEVAGNLTSYVDNATALSTTLLNWDAGGNPSLINGVQPTYKYDHSGSPHLAVLANSLHGVPAVAAGVTSATYGSARAGILFGAQGSTLYWSANGYPWYWPILNAEDLDDNIEAIVTARAVTYVFTRSGVYAVSGTNDANLTITRTASPYGCLPRSGRAVLQTPYGFLYPCREGLALFDGSSSRLVAPDLLTAGSITVNGTTDSLFAAYQDGLYVLNVSNFNFCYAWDLRRWPDVSLCRVNSPSTMVAFARTHPHSTILDINGLYLLDDSLNIKPWSPIQGGHSATRDPLWTWSSGYLTGGDLVRQKSMANVWLSFVGTAPSVALKGYTWDGVQVAGTQTITSGGPVVNTFTRVDYVTIDVTAGAADCQVIGIRADLEAVA